MFIRFLRKSHSGWLLMEIIFLDASFISEIDFDAYIPDEIIVRATQDKIRNTRGIRMLEFCNANGVVNCQREITDHTRRILVKTHAIMLITYWQAIVILRR